MSTNSATARRQTANSSFTVNKANLQNTKSLLLQMPAELSMSSLEKLPASRFLGSSAVFFRVEPGVVLKAPVTVSKDKTIRERPSVAKNYIVERQIFDRLGQHPRIVRCLGWVTEFPTGLLLAEASHGSLQYLIDTDNEAIPLSLRKRWVRQAIESLAYIHDRGVIHSDLRPDNFLVHGNDLWLCDFGKSACEELGISGGGVPDAGFFDPSSPWESTPSTDIFSLGSILYTILRGHWPYRTQSGSFETLEEMDQYAVHAEALFRKGKSRIEIVFASLTQMLGALQFTMVARKRNTSAEFPTYLDMFNEMNPFTKTAGYQIGSRLIPRSAILDSGGGAFVAALCEISTQYGGTISGVSFNVSQTPAVENAVNPASREASLSPIVGTVYNYENLNENLVNQELMTDTIVPKLAGLIPGGGSAYLNKGDPWEPRWQEVFYGPNYDRLLKVKNKYDPTGMLYSLTSVGSEAWTQRNDGGLSRSSEID
ncbi:hypothetical protein NPX13_g6826 [Xylaria arbuscula]|uniref:EKC/KEOPS complex subunit BUD32 n=1 Tax=Xylaria arbuscula TaxID=114810 RepID=A0A9W8TL15_9PEZI|nr:hypothetical protein NPX13_g6826 [Xylaria arbuscula]